MTSTANTATSFLPRSYSQGGYNVTINADRSIKVRPGDWLSKYSMAIYGNFDHVDAFWRKDDEGNFYEIIDKDLIDAGETLYHPGPLPNEPPGGSPGVAPPVRGTPGGKQPLRPRNVSDFLQWLKQRFVTTDWRVSGTGGGDLALSVVTIQYATIGIVKKSVAVETWFHAIAGGLTIGFPFEGFPTSGGGSFSTTHFPSIGTIVRFAWRRELSLSDFRHGIIVLELGGNLATAVGAGPGGSVALVIFGIQFPAILLMAIGQYFRDGNVSGLQNGFNRTAPAGVAILAGGTVGLPGVSVAGRAGAMYDRGYFGR